MRRTDFYGLGKWGRVIFVLFFTPGYHRVHPVDEFIGNRLQDEPSVASAIPRW